MSWNSRWEMWIFVVSLSKLSNIRSWSQNNVINFLYNVSIFSINFPYDQMLVNRENCYIILWSRTNVRKFRNI